MKKTREKKARRRISSGHKVYSINFELPYALHEKIKKAAKEEDRTIAAYLRLLIKQHLED